MQVEWRAAVSCGDGTLARLFVIIGSLIVLALTAALVGPYFINWTNYRADFEREASRILGRQVTVEGEATARLLPFPSVTFSDVRVAGAGDEPAMTVETFSMDAELAPFLSGEVLIFDMRLVRPKAVIAVGEDGAIDWTMRPSAPFDPHHIRLEKLTITEGAIAIRHAPSGRTHMLTEINTDVAARSLAGPWRVAGSLRLDGMLTDLEVSTGAVDAGAMRVRIRAKPQRYPLIVEMDGDAAIRDGAGRYGGTFKIAAYDKEPRPSGPQGEKVAGVPVFSETADYRLNGAFTLDHRRLAVAEFRFATGSVEDPYTADGTAEIELGAKPRFHVSATGAQLRFDESMSDGKETVGLTLGKRVDALKQFLLALPKPAIPGSVDVSLPALVAGDTTFRDVRLSAEPAEGGWRVGEFAASLPGRTKLEASGMVTAADEDAHFSGEMLLAVGQPSGFAAWLARDVDDAIRRLPAAGFAAKVDLSSERQEFRDLELRLGTATFGGRIEHLTPADARPALLAELDGGELDVEGLAAFASLFVSDAGASRFADRDLDLKVTAGPVNLAGMTAAKIDAALRLKEAQLDIDRLSISDLAGANVSATGTISGFPADPTGKLDASILSGDLGPLVALVGERFRDNRLAAGLAQRFAAFPELGTDARIDLVATSAREGDGARFAISASGAVGGTAFSMALSGNGTPFDPEALDFDYSAHNDDAGPILALYGLPALPLQIAGPARTDLMLTGSPAEGMSASFRLRGETAAATFDGTVRPEDEAYSAAGKASVSGEDIAPWLSAMGIALPGLELGAGAQLTADVAFSKDTLSLANLAGAVVGSDVSGDIAASLKDGVPHLEGKLQTAALPFDLAAALVLGQAPLEPGDDVWPETPFPAALALPFTADLAIQAGAVTTPGRTLATDASFRAKLGHEGLAVSDLAAGTLGGRLTGLFELRNNEGTGLATAQLSLAGADLAAFPGASALSGAGDFTAGVNASGKSVGGMVASLSGTGTANLRELVVDGLNAEGVPALIAEADRIGRDIDAAAVDDFAPAIARQGRFAADPVELAFTVAGGVLRTAPVTLAAGSTGAMAELRVDLSSWTLQAEGQLTYDPGLEALVGSEPSFNFTVSGEPGQLAMTLDMQSMTQFLTQRALEIEQARVEAMQAALLEKQRLRREVRYYAALQEDRRRAEEARAAEEARVKAEEARIRAEQEAREAEEARQRAGEEARQKAEQEALIRAEAEARAAEEARSQAEREAQQKAEEARIRTEEKTSAERAARARAEDEMRREAEDARIRAEQEARARAEEERRRAVQPAPATGGPAPATGDGAQRAPADDLPDMAGRAPVAPQPSAPQDRPVPQADVGPRQPERQAPGGFSLDSLFRSLTTD